MNPGRKAATRAYVQLRERLQSLVSGLRQLARGGIGEAVHGKPARALLTDRGLAGMSLALLLLVLLNAVLGLSSIATLTDNQALVNHTQDVQTQILLIEKTMLDAEAGQRGYVLTGDASYLRPYDDARAQIGGELAQFQALVSDNPTQLARLAQLRPLVGDKMSEMQQTIDLRQQGHLDEALAIIHTDLGKQTMDDIRTLLAAANQTEQQLLRQHDASTASALRWAIFTIILTTLLLIALVAATYALARSLLGQREQVAVEREQLLEAERAARTEAEAATAKARAAVGLRDQFLSIAAHELRSPLTVMLTNTQLLERRLAREGINEERIHPAVEGLKRQINRLRGLIEAMLDVSRIEGGQLSIAKQRVDVTELVRALVHDAELTTEKHTITLELPERPVYVEADTVRLEQVVQNLITNAIKYSPNGGTIVVRLTAPGEEAEISVSDQGLGIAPEAIAHLFDRYYRAPGASEHIKGMGIGLYVVREIVRLHGGEVSVTSTPGMGSTFTVGLPLAAAPRERAEHTTPSQGTTDARKNALPGPV